MHEQGQAQPRQTFESAKLLKRSRSVATSGVGSTDDAIDTASACDGILFFEVDHQPVPSIRLGAGPRYFSSVF